MAAMKPRTGDGPMEAVKEGRLIIVRVPLEGGGRLVVSVNDDEAKELHDALAGVVIHKRTGTTDVGRWYVTTTVDELLALITGTRPAR